VVQRKKLFWTRLSGWSSALFIFAFAIRVPIEASSFTTLVNSEMLVTVGAVQDSLPPQRQFASGKLSRRAKAAQKRKMPTTTTVTATVDTNIAAQLEAIRALPRDSSARIAQFTYIRKDEPAVNATYHREHPLFLATPPIVKYQAALDSTKWIYRIRRMVNDDDSRIPIDVPFEEYSALRLQQTVRKNWEFLSQSYTLQTGAKTTLGDLMGKITNIEVPIPKNPIFSVFGPNIIKLNVNGAIDIHAGFRNTKYDLASSNPLGQSQSTPDFKQQIQVNVNGEIGDKLKIAADWNTQRTFEYENQLHVKYTGYEDEIVQSVEAGNVSLPTNSSFISGGSALFGIMAKFQIGPLNLTTVATQKKGQIKEISVSGGSEAKPIEIRPAEYSRNHFFIDTSYISKYEDVYLNNFSTGDMTIREIEVWVTSTASVPPQGARNVVAFMNQDTVEILQKDSLARRRNYDQIIGEREPGSFIKLEYPTEYTYNKEAGIISLRTALQDNQAIAVYYVIGNPSDHSPRYIGNSGQVQRDAQDSSKLIMKLVRPRNLQNNMTTAWRLMLKNRYPLLVSGIDRQSFEFHMEYQLPGQTATREVLPQNIGLMELFGIDRYSGTSGLAPPDKVFDYSAGLTIDELNGEIIFPTVEPFDSLSIRKFLYDHRGLNIAGETALSNADINAYSDSLSYDAIYDTTASAAQNDPRNRYFLRGNAKGTGGQASFDIGFSTVEGSVVVTSGGQRLTPGVDYTVDYISNKVIIKNQMYLAAGRDIQIKYEANDMFQLASKSLMGARGEFNLGKTSTLGFTIMNYSQQSLSDKVRLGEEPISNMMMGIDGRTSLEAPWITNALNYIPGIKTTAPSQISFGGEFAYMLPNPNTRTSPIPSDGGKGVAYIDDFEGARQTIPLGGAYLAWKDASAPWYSPQLDSFSPSGVDGRSVPFSESLINNGILADTTKMNYKARASWFNVLPSDVYIPDIWANKSYAAGEGQVTSLDFYFRPAERGAFNYSMDLEHTIGLGNTNDSSHTKSWAGIQRALGTTSTDLIEQNIAFIELWVNILQHQDSLAKLNIDLGYISEDVIPNRRMNTEDGLDVPNHIPRGKLNPDYDWGLDMMSDTAERDLYSKNGFLARYPQYSGDPSGDNWAQLPTGGALRVISDADRYDKVDGTEQNHLSAEGLFPDGEDMNGNKVLDRTNSYFEYEVPLDTASAPFRKIETGKGKNGWYQIRIPLSEYTRRIGSPTLTSVEGVRLWITGAREPMLFRIVDFNLVGNQWEKRDNADTSFDISVVNVEDNPNYTPPPGVTQQKDLTRPDQNILGNEQALNIIVKHLSDGQEKEAVRFFAQKPLDMFNYRTLKMFVHGETGLEVIKGYNKFKYVDTSNYDAQFFIRFGDDISNYYEYQAPIHEGWRGNDVIIKFGDLTALKALDSATISRGVPIADGSPGARYRMSGNPRLDAIKFISIGIKNPNGKGDTVLTGELWANELRLTDVDDTPGWAYKFDAKIALADMGSISFSLTEQNPFFHQLEVPFGNRNTSRSWNFSTSFSFGKLLPDSWNGTIFDVSYSHSESMNKPRYVPGTDILVEKAADAVASTQSTSSANAGGYKNADDVRLKTEDLSITDSYSVPTIKFNIPSTTWLVTETINKMSFGYNYSISHRRDRLTEFSEAWSWNANFRYGTQFNKNNYVSPFSIFGNFFLLRPWKNFKLFFTPQDLSFGASLNRGQSKSRTRISTINSITHTMGAQRSMSFNWQFFEGGLFDLGIGYNVSVSSSLDHLDMRNGKLRSFYDILSDIFFSDRLINFGIDQNYSQAINFNTKISTPKVLMLDKIITPTFRYGVNYGWTNNIALGPLGKSANWSANPSASLDFNLKPISEAIWPSKPSSVPVDTGAGKKGNDPLKQLGNISRILIKNTLFDFEKFSISFTQSNAVQNNGVRGSNGFANLFARVPFFQSSLDENGPSLYYQLGLMSDPNGRLVLKTKSTFPFISGYTVPGLRAPAGSGMSISLADNFSQTNNISMQTSRPLWEGATLDLNWKVGWNYNENRTSLADSFGHPTTVSRAVSGSIDRSFISLPSFLMFKFFNTNLENVNKKYQALKQQDADNVVTTDAAKLSQAFEEGLEAFPWITKILGSFAPRANWSIRWGGLEKFSLFKSFATSVSLDHAYSSNYSQRWQLNQSGNKDITSQSVMYGFAPLIGLNVSFKDLAKGKLSASFRYNTTTTYNLTPSSSNVGEELRSDIAISATFSRQGFEIPFFGLSLMNNIDIQLTYGYSHNSSLRYDFSDFRKDGLPMGGQGTTTIEPRIRYTLSERVTASLYYRYSKLTPDEGGSTISGSTTNEGGLDINIAIK
jgi:cell surface protein SprA